MSSRKDGQPKVIKYCQLTGVIQCLLLVLLASSCATTKSFTSPREYVKEGLKYYNNTDYSQAARYFEKAIELDPTHQPAHSWLGASYAYLGRKDDAIREFRKVVKIDPGTKDALSASRWIESLQKPISIFILELEDSTTNRRFKKYRLGKVATSGLARNLNKIGRYEANVIQPNKMVGYFPGQSLDTKNLCTFSREHGGGILIIGSVTNVMPQRISSTSSSLKWYAHTEILIHLYNTRTSELIKSINGSTDWLIERLGNYRASSQEKAIEKSLNYCSEILVDEIKKYLP